VFAADHGIAREGVSAFPAEVTPQMVLNFLAGGAAINVLCRHEGISLRVVDMGVDYDFSPRSGLIDKKIRKGTRNFLQEEALTAEEAKAALEAGMEVFRENILPGAPELTAVGEMGIGNTTSASAIIAAVTGKDPCEVTGRGTGIDEARWKHKVGLIEKALARHKPNPADGIDLLRKIGGLEIAGMAGFILASVSQGVPVVLDGLIATAGALIAWVFRPAIEGYLFAGHYSVEQGQKHALAKMRLTPILDLGLRLGEGTGAALAMNIVDASCKVMCEMASFEKAGITHQV
jgi:nicotinate-nucleotide--dimethylbenzimidazole phosphoribosyltransferase